jgi:hypothetical protein
MIKLALIQAPNEAWDLIEGILNLGSREQHKIAEAVRLGFAWNFAHESGGGEPWAPLAPMTVAERHQLGFAGEHPILQRTRELKRSLVEEDHPLSTTETSTHGYYSQLTRIEIELGSADERFPLLHAGGITDQGYYVPARPMTVLSDEAIRRLRETIEYVLHERWARLPHEA